METTACNQCGSAESEEIGCIPDLLLERLEVTARLVRCRRCGLVYQNPRPTLAEMGQHYPQEYEPYTDYASQRQVNPLLRRAYAYGINKRCRFVTEHKKNGKLLDIGCAAGTFLLGMRAQPGWEVEGVEPSAATAELARQHGLKVFTGTLEEAHYPSGSFDAVTMWDVLEHVHDPAATLAEIRRVLKPGGILLVRVPNLASWDARLFGRSWAGLDAPRHLFVFTPQTLRRMLRDQGLQVVEESSKIGSYVTFALSVRFWMTDRGVRPAARQRVNRLLNHPIARVASAPLFYIPSLLRRGPLLVTIAQKDQINRQ
jgi:2-polyprenyl-3-methyl-5-hydroxy-6-metoxy-1,4-benzoquinol methylase